MSVKIPEEVLDAIKHNKTHQRLVHKTKQDGSICSGQYSPALVVTKRCTHWFWYCHRCKEHGQLPFETNTPKQTLALIKRQNKELYNNKKDTIALPHDYVLLSHTSGPAKAKTWLWKYGIGLNLWKKYRIGWSDSYQRVIFPVHEDKELKHNLKMLNVLVGWVARDVGFISNVDKVLYNAPKYLMRRIPGDGRKFFTICNKNAARVVIVEDILSAIKIYENVSHVNVVALLNASVDAAYMLRNFKKQTIHIWLDNNKRNASIMQTQRLVQFGFITHHIFTMKDPKFLTEKEIRNKI